MIDEVIGAFQLKRGIFISPDDAASMLKSVSYVVDIENVKNNRDLRIPLRLATGDPIGDCFFVAMTVLDVSIALAIDQRPSITPIFASNLSKAVGLSNKDLLICKIKRQDIKCKDFETVCMLTHGIPNFRARCESIIALNDHSLREIDRFVQSKEFDVEIVRLKDEDKSSYHTFTFASQDGEVKVADNTLLGALVKFASISKKNVAEYVLDPSVLEKMTISVDTHKDGVSEMKRYVSGGNKIVHIGSKVVAKPTNLMKSKIVGTVIGKSANVINVKWDSGVMKYDLNNPKTYFLLEFVD